MMQPTHFWDFPDRANLWPLDRPRSWTIHGQGPVRAPAMIIVEEGFNLVVVAFSWAYGDIPPEDGMAHVQGGVVRGNEFCPVAAI
jgi:hypothetical protein